MKSEPARLPRRLAAYVADCALLFAFVLVSQAVLFLAGVHPFEAAFRGLTQVRPPYLHLWVVASVSVPALAYFAASFASARGATLGQRAAGIAVKSVSLDRLPATDAILRALVLLLPFEINHAVMFHAAPPAVGMEGWFAAGLATVWLLCLLYVALPLVRSDRRSLHDLAAGSVVLR